MLIKIISGFLVGVCDKGNNKITEQSYKGKVKTHNYINRQNQSTTGKLKTVMNPAWVQAFLKKWWVESDFIVWL